MNALIDFFALKRFQPLAWATGDYALIGTALQVVGESLAEACQLHWDETLLGVATGNGSAALAAARCLAWTWRWFSRWREQAAIAVAEPAGTTGIAASATTAGTDGSPLQALG